MYLPEAAVRCQSLVVAARMYGGGDHRRESLMLPLYSIVVTKIYVCMYAQDWHKCV